MRFAKSEPRPSRIAAQHSSIDAALLGVDTKYFVGARMKPRRISNSPLLDPSICALVLFAPDTHEQAPIDPSTHVIYRRTVPTVIKAAEIASVPVFVLSHPIQQEKQSPSPTEPATPSHRRFVFEDHTSPWAHKAFVEALAADDRSILILAGFWLEHEILATALHALVDGYDVYVLLDATPARSRLAFEPARERLNQAGAIPVIASQVVNEWSIEAQDAPTRSALVSLLPPLIDAG
jgi:nicotinamidase-related amidase